MHNNSVHFINMKIREVCFYYSASVNLFLVVTFDDVFAQKVTRSVLNGRMPVILQVFDIGLVFAFTSIMKGLYVSNTSMLVIFATIIPNNYRNDLKLL